MMKAGAENIFEYHSGIRRIMLEASASSTITSCCRERTMPNRSDGGLFSRKIGF
jgi:hypothetical protein